MSLLDPPVVPDRNRLTQSFIAFLNVLFSALIAIFLAWRLLLYGNEEEHLQMEPSMQSLRALLPTDSFVSNIECQTIARNDTQLLYVPNEITTGRYLRSIPEEDIEESGSRCSSERTPVTKLVNESGVKSGCAPGKTSDQSISTSAISFEHHGCFDIPDLPSIDSDSESINILLEGRNRGPVETTSTKYGMADQDRDQSELLYDYFSDTINAREDSYSLNSTSISLGHSRDSILDLSICSNPIDEVSIMEKTLTGESMDTNERVTEIVRGLLAEGGAVASTTNTVVHRTDAHRTDHEQSKPPLASIDSEFASYVSPENPDSIGQPSLRFERTYLEGSRNIKNSDQRDRIRPLDMLSPPLEPPPPPPITNGISSYKNFEESSFKNREKAEMPRSEDVQTENRSKSTIREIPVQRSVSSYTTPSVTPSVVEYRSGSLVPWGDNFQQEQYYRKEVMTRTYVTRSTETLSMIPSRSPVEKEVRSWYSKNIEEEENRIRGEQEKRRLEEEDRRRKAEDERRIWELQEREYLERIRKESDRKHREMEHGLLEKERLEKIRLEKDRNERERIEMLRRAEWERAERERRSYEELDLDKKKEYERQRLEEIRREEERRLKEKLEKERMEREMERLERERVEKERIERERIERERIEIERIEIERIERLKREKEEREKGEREKQKKEEERLEKERIEQERIAREKRELMLLEQELLETQRREAEIHEAERLKERAREARRREEELREAELLAEMQRKAEEREAKRRMDELLEKERLENLWKEKERLENERKEFERREQQRKEEERREKELIEAQRRAAERREKERLDEAMRERARREEEKRENERREAERREAQRRESERQMEEEMEREKAFLIEKAKQERRAARLAEMKQEEQRASLERKTSELRELEKREMERREQERIEEERRLGELRERERRNAEQRDRERREAEEREARRREDNRRSRDKLDHLAREIEEKEKMEMEKRRLLELWRQGGGGHRDILTSRETLERLTKAPYYSRENLTTQSPDLRDTEVTTKVERQVIERVDRKYWTEEPSRYLPNSVTMISERSSSPLRDRPYLQRKLTDDEEFNRNSSRRTSRYKSKLEKARKDFLTSETSPTQDPISDRFRRTSDDIQRSNQEYRIAPLPSLSTEDLIPKEGMLRRETLPYARVGPSPYDRLEETNLDDVHRSRSAMDYNRQSRRDIPDSENSHIRSRSADYLMDRKTREETAPPENDLQKFGDRASQMSDHEMRFRKSTEKLHVPDWYRARKPVRITDLDASSLSNSEQYNHQLLQYTTNESFSSQKHGNERPIVNNTTSQSSIYIPHGMFDKYKDEIENMRRSRSSLGQFADDRKDWDEPSVGGKLSSYQDQDENSAELMLSDHDKSIASSVHYANKDNSDCRRIEVTAGMHDVKRNQLDSEKSHFSHKFVSAENVLHNDIDGDHASNSISNGQMRNVATVRLGISNIHDSDLSDTAPKLSINGTHLGIFSEIIPHNFEESLMRCENCDKKEKSMKTNSRFVSCKYCYSNYCSRKCREDDWISHKQLCSFARINVICKDVIMKVRKDVETQWFLSKVAREGYDRSGRGSVNFRFASANLAISYLIDGWRVLSHLPLDCILQYRTIDDLTADNKGSSMIKLCQRYDPTEKFILSVSIIADLERCPETPPSVMISYERLEDLRADSIRLDEFFQREGSNSSIIALHRRAIPTQV